MSRINSLLEKMNQLSSYEEARNWFKDLSEEDKVTVIGLAVTDSCLKGPTFNFWSSQAPIKLIVAGIRESADRLEASGFEEAEIEDAAQN